MVKTLQKFKYTSRDVMDVDLSDLVLFLYCIFVQFSKQSCADVLFRHMARNGWRIGMAIIGENKELLSNMPLITGKNSCVSRDQNSLMLLSKPIACV